MPAEERYGPPLSWLALRAQRVERLCTRGGPGLPLLMPALRAMAGGQCRSVALEGLAGDADAAIAALAALPALRCLSLSPGLCGELVACVEGVAALAAATALESLSLGLDRLAGPSSSRELGAALSGLTSLRLAARREAAVVPPELLESAGRLRRLDLANCRLAQFTPAMAEALQGLEFLAVDGERQGGAPSCLLLRGPAACCLAKTP